MPSNDEENLASQIVYLLKYLRERVAELGGSVPEPFASMTEGELSDWARDLARQQLEILRKQHGELPSDFTFEFVDNPFLRDWVVDVAARSKQASSKNMPTGPDADGARIFYRKGMLKLEKGLPKEACTMLKKAVQLIPTYVEAWEALVVVYEALGQPEKSFQAALRARELKEE